MRRFSFAQLLGVLLIVCVFFSALPVNAYAQTPYTVETGNKVLSPALLPYSYGTQIMIPFRATTEALGGIWLDLPIGTAHKTAILNDKVLFIMTGINCQVVLSLTEEIDFSTANGVDDYAAILVPLMLDGTIPVKKIDYPIEEQSGDLYIPLEVFTSALDLDAYVDRTTINFKPGFVYYQPTNFNVTFQLDVTSKTYDGKPFTPSEKGIKVFCDGVQVTDYLPLSFEYMYTDMNADLQSVDGLPVNAGGYALAVRTNVNDPKYSGTGYFSFMIYPADLVLTVKDETISAGESFPEFSCEVSGIVPGETRADALVVEPLFSVDADTTRPGTYRIEASGGKAGLNYNIKNRQSGTLTISSGAKVEVIQIHCVDALSDSVLLTSQQQAPAGASITVNAPALEGYQVSGQPQQQIIAGEGTVVTFYYTPTDHNPGEIVQIRCVDAVSESVLLTSQQQAPNGTSITVNAPALEGYQVSGQPQQQIIAEEGIVVTFYYTLTDSSINQNLGDPSPTTHLPYITGYKDGTFRPKSNVTRSEIAVMLYRLLTQMQDIEEPEGAVWRFLDTPPGTWYDTAVCTLALEGIVNGYEDGSFRPEHMVTRAEFVTMALRLVRITPSGAGRQFKDVSQTHWAVGYIQTAAGSGLITGYSDGTFRPNQYITRAEAVTILNRVSERSECVAADSTLTFSDVPANYWAYPAIMLAANIHSHS